MWKITLPTWAKKPAQATMATRPFLISFTFSSSVTTGSSAKPKGSKAHPPALIPLTSTATRQTTATQDQPRVPWLFIDPSVQCQTLDRTAVAAS